MTDAETRYFQAVSRVEQHRASFNQQYQLIRMWPAEHPFQEMPDDIYEPLKEHSIEMGLANDEVAAAWRALKKERKETQNAD